MSLLASAATSEGRSSATSSVTSSARTSPSPPPNFQLPKFLIHSKAEATWIRPRRRRSRRERIVEAFGSTVYHRLGSTYQRGFCLFSLKVYIFILCFVTFYIVFPRKEVYYRGKAFVQFFFDAQGKHAFKNVATVVKSIKHVCRAFVHLASVFTR